MIVAALLLATSFANVDRALITAVETQHTPGAVIGIVIDGKLAYVKTAGVRDTSTNALVTEDTVFRIASMTKGFTAMAILKLRDEGNLALDDPAAKYVPELKNLKYPTKDAPVITIRHLLTHSEGFPKTTVGRRQLAQSNETMSAWLRGGSRSRTRRHGVRVFELRIRNPRADHRACIGKPYDSTFAKHLAPSA